MDWEIMSVLGCWADCCSHRMDDMGWCWAVSGPWNHYQKNGLGCFAAHQLLLIPTAQQCRGEMVPEAIPQKWLVLEMQGRLRWPLPSFSFLAHVIIYSVWRQKKLLYKYIYRSVFLLLRPGILNFVKYLQALFSGSKVSYVCQSF